MRKYNDFAGVLEPIVVPEPPQPYPQEVPAPNDPPVPTVPIPQIIPPPVTPPTA